MGEETSSDDARDEVAVELQKTLRQLVVLRQEGAKFDEQSLSLILSIIKESSEIHSLEVQQLKKEIMNELESVVLKTVDRRLNKMFMEAVADSQVMDAGPDESRPSYIA